MTLRFLGSLCLYLIVFCLWLIGEAHARAASDTGEVASQSHLELPAGARSRTYEFVFVLPEVEVEAGVVFTARQITVDGDLGIVEESMSRTIYFVRVRLVASRERPVRGTVSIRLTKGAVGTPLPLPLPAPTDPVVFGDPFQPEFVCRAEGSPVLFKLHDRDHGDEVWARAFTDGGRGRLDEGRLSLGHRYVLEVRQANAWARYSPAAWVPFRIDKVERPCPSCQGTGLIPDTWHPCPRCRGQGWLDCPALIPEPAMDRAPVPMSSEKGEPADARVASD